ncbi:MAG: aminopeptidase P family protein, partial [Thermoprotei archaeon]
MVGTRFPRSVLVRRLEKFRERVCSGEVDAVMIRTLSSYAYFTGVKWLRPALLIPCSGEPVAFVAKGEEEGFREKTWIERVVTYIDGGDLMRRVSGIIREEGYRAVGLEFGVERDAYILFYEMFKRLNPGVKVVDVSEILDEMKMVKDEYELKAIRVAGSKARKAVEHLESIAKPGVSETELAAEAYSILYRLGSEQPQVYINAGPHPRIHAEPFHDIKLRDNTFVTIVVGANHN